MKIAITGHSRGIGKSIYQCLEQAGHQCVGFSRSNGFDIANTAELISAVGNADVLINNAYYEFYQVDVFTMWYNKHKHDCAKTIVNIGSIIKNTMPNDTSVAPRTYSACKKQLAAITKKARAEHDKQCRIININPGFVNTELNDINEPSLQTDQCAEAVRWALSQPPNVEICELSLKSIF